MSRILGDVLSFDRFALFSFKQQYQSMLAFLQIKSNPAIDVFYKHSFGTSNTEGSFIPARTL